MTDDAPGDRPRIGPAGEPVSQDGTSYWDGRHWVPLAEPFRPLPSASYAALGAKQEYDGWIVAEVAVGTVVILGVGAWFVPWVAIVPFVILIGVLMVGVTIRSGPTTRIGRSIRQGLLIGSAITACLSPVAACFSVFMGPNSL